MTSSVAIEYGFFARLWLCVASVVDIQALIGNEDNTIGYSCKLLKAYPIQVGQVDLGNSAEGLIEINVTWEYDNWKIQDVREGFDLGR